MAESSLELIADQIVREREEQSRHFQGLDTKAGIVLGFSGVLIGLGFQTTSVMGVVGLGAAVLASILAVAAFFPRRYPVLETRRLRERYAEAEARFRRVHLLDTQIRMIEETSLLIERKAVRLKVPLLSLSAGGLLFSAGTVVRMVQG